MVKSAAMQRREQHQMMQQQLMQQQMMQLEGTSPQNQRHHRGRNAYYHLLMKVSVLALMALTVYATVRSNNALAMSESLRILETAMVPSHGVGGFAPSRPPNNLPYQPAPVEDYIVKHTVQLGLSVKPPETVPTCFLWTDPNSTPYYQQLTQFYQELKEYYVLLNNFRLPADIQDVRYDTSPHGDVCSQVELNPLGLEGIFKSQQLSRTNAGFVEPLVPPMRHPALCLEEGVGVPGRVDKIPQLMQIRYLVHDWAHMCRQLLPTSKTVFIDMGASLQFHGNHPSPALVLLEQFRRFGIKFDHIYAYEMLPHDPLLVQNAIPKQFKSAYHWINVGVQPLETSPHNPWNLLLDNFTEDDLVIVKLDIDTPAIEHPLAYQLLNNPRLAKLVDHFYFEHHVNQRELAPHWGAVDQSVEESFELFHQLRQKGVASHFWV